MEVIDKLKGYELNSLEVEDINECISKGEKVHYHESGCSEMVDIVNIFIDLKSSLENTYKDCNVHLELYKSDINRIVLDDSFDIKDGLIQQLKISITPK